MLKEKLLEDLKDAMKTKNVNKKNAVQMVRTAILQIEKDKGIEVSDEQILGIVAKEVKTRKDAIAEYSKRLSRYCKLEILEVADEKTPDGASEIVEENIREKEGERILKLIKEDAYVITLEISGKMLTSEELADRISLAEVIEALPEQDKQLIRLRFYGNRTQSETAKALHTTQVQISRRERKILIRLRARLLEE